MEQEIIFDSLEPVQVKVKVGTALYWLVEASEGDAITYRDYGLSCRRYDSEGTFVGVEGLAESESLLVSLCLRERGPNDEMGKPVDQETIRSWGSRVVKTLFRRAQEISDLSEPDMTVEEIDRAIDRLQKRRRLLANGSTREKNSPNATRDNSAQRQS